MVHSFAFNLACPAASAARFFSTFPRTRSRMQLTLVVPELIWPEPEDRDVFADLACPALEALLTRGRRTDEPPQSLEATLADLFGHPEGAPYAAFRLLGEAESSLEIEEKSWLIADPVHLRFHQERLILADGASLAISAEEAQALADGLNAHFADLGRFHVTVADRWYLHLADDAPLNRYVAPPLSTVTGRSVEHLLPELLHERPMRTLMNEIQTVLHAHPVNQRRADEGRLPINSLWFWGNGQLPPRRETDFDGVWSLNPLARGLARAAGVRTHPVPDDAERFFEHAAPDTAHLIVLEDLAGPVQFENGAAYRAAIESLETRWFAPLRTALFKGRLKSLHIEASTVYAKVGWQCRRSDQWKLWVRPRPLADLAISLAHTAN